MGEHIAYTVPHLLALGLLLLGLVLCGALGNVLALHSSHDVDNVDGLIILVCPVPIGTKHASNAVATGLCIVTDTLTMVPCFFGAIIDCLTIGANMEA